MLLCLVLKQANPRSEGLWLDENRHLTVYTAWSQRFPRVTTFLLPPPLLCWSSGCRSWRITLRTRSTSTSAGRSLRRTRCCSPSASPWTCWCMTMRLVRVPSVGHRCSCYRKTVLGMYHDVMSMSERPCVSIIQLRNQRRGIATLGPVVLEEIIVCNALIFGAT